jgi:NADH-quinone oxidoreductase subunit L
VLLSLIILFPVVGWAINGAVGAHLPRRLVGLIGTGAVGLSFLATVLATLFPDVGQSGFTVALFPWIVTGGLSVQAGVLLDPLSSLMALVVTGVGFLIHVYSIGYMADDHHFSRYFAYLNLFIASMLVLVLASNLLVMFVGWELVGLCSYLLIGFWFERDRAAAAARKAFVVNRIGDAGFLLGVLLLAVTAGTLEFGGLNKAAATMAPPIATIATLLLVAGATGKSAQLPLHIWLPDAMEGPTPVSALIHAATMVTAGVYMIARLHPVFVRAPTTLTVVTAVGAASAFVAATVALAEWDLKRVLAYSTISQLGYMFMGMGLVAMPAGMFHLMTHAFFKALLFLAAGSVMHAMDGIIDLRQLGGLAQPLRFTALAFVIGGLALAGIPPLSGFVSKDLILEQAFHYAQMGGTSLWWIVGLVTALITALYVTRALFWTFGPPASYRGHPHEAPTVMVWPMGVLVVLSIGGGIAGAGFAGKPLLRALDHFFAIPAPGREGAGGLVVVLSVGVGVLGIIAGAALTRDRRDLPLGPIGAFFRRQWFIEDAYRVLLVSPAAWLARLLAGTIEVRIIDGTVNAVAGGIGRMASGLRQLQSGYVRAYATVILAGTILVLGYWLLRP